MMKKKKVESTKPAKGKVSRKTTGKSKVSAKDVKRVAQKLIADALHAESGEPPLIGIVAPASPLPMVELELNSERIARLGFSIGFHPQVQNIDGIFAGTDTERALAFLDYAYDPEMDILWGGRGGYGVIRMLSILDEVVHQVGPPPVKTLVGYSDLTILLDYVASRWGWRVIHGPMPATQQFFKVSDAELEQYMKSIRGDALPAMPLKTLCSRPGITKVEGVLAGGNLATIASVVGTPFQANYDGKILFLEEVGEYVYRVDRLLQQMILSRSLQGVRAIVLGTFTQFEDACPQVLKSRPKNEAARLKAEMKPLRPLLPADQVQKLEYLFRPLSESLGIPVYHGLNVGHGNGTGAIELNVKVKIDGKKLTYL